LVLCRVPMVRLTAKSKLCRAPYPKLTVNLVLCYVSHCQAHDKVTPGYETLNPLMNRFVRQEIPRAAASFPRSCPRALTPTIFSPCASTLPAPAAPPLHGLPPPHPSQLPCRRRPPLLYLPRTASSLLCFPADAPAHLPYASPSMPMPISPTPPR
jgi:hypothetical protein